MKTKSSSDIIFNNILNIYIPDIYVFPCGLDGQQPEKRNSLLHFFRFSAARDVEGDLANLKHR